MLVTTPFLKTWTSTLAGDLQRLTPELLLGFTVLLLLFLRMFRGSSRLHLGGIAFGGALAALVSLWAPELGFWNLAPGSAAFTGLLQLDPASQYLRTLIVLGTLLLVVLSRITAFPTLDDDADFYTLLLGSTVGLMLLVTANHLAMIFLALEMASLPSYVLSGFRKDRRGSEAALKYVLFGAASAGAALYGVSWLVLSFGTGDLSSIAAQVAQRLTTGDGLPPMVLAGFALLLLGVGFKLAVVPFHFWLPDVFSGTTAEIGAFLSVVSKIAAVGLLARLLLTLQGALATVDAVYLPKVLGPILVLVAILTMSLGNFAALAQTDLKRLLAYSTIAHAGYLLLGLATFHRDAIQAVYFYLAAYLLMNLGAFATLALLRQAHVTEDIAGCQGLLYRSPLVAITFAFALLSLLGLPPLAGFVGKFQVFATVFEAGRACQRVGQGSLANFYYVGLAVALLNTLLSAGYYLKVLKAIGLDEPVQGAAPLVVSRIGTLLLGLLAVGTLTLGLAAAPLVSFLSNR